MVTFAQAGWKTIQSIGQYRSEQNPDVKNKMMEEGLICAAKAARAALVYFTLYAANFWVGHLGIKAALVAVSWCVSSPATLEVAALAPFRWVITYWNSSNEVSKQFAQKIDEAVKVAAAQGMKKEECYSIIPVANSIVLILSAPFEKLLIARGEDVAIKSLFKQTTTEFLKFFGCAIAYLFSAAVYCLDSNKRVIRFQDPLNLDAKIATWTKNCVKK
jgi:hypothetical protein